MIMCFLGSHTTHMPITLTADIHNIMLGLRTTLLVLLPALATGFLAPTPALRYALVLFLSVMTMPAAP